MATTEQIDQVRLLIADTAIDDDDRLLTDTQIGTFLTLNTDSVRLAAADALEAIAVSETLVGKRIRTQDLTTDGAAVSAELRQLAARYRDQAAREDAAADAWDGFDVVDTVKGSRRPEASEYPVVWGL